MNDWIMVHSGLHKFCVNYLSCSHCLENSSIRWSTYDKIEIINLSHIQIFYVHYTEL